MTEVIRIIGIDPGLRCTGWGMIEQDGSRLRHLAHGVIKIDPALPLAARLGGIFAAVRDVVIRYRPDVAGVEETLVNANPRQALKLGQARGAALVALAHVGVTVDEYAPRAIKKAVTGTGSADKNQVMFMVARLLPRAGAMTPDAADALACAICTACHGTGPGAVRSFRDRPGAPDGRALTKKSFRV